MEERKNRALKGIRIQNLNYCMIFVSCVLYALLLYVTVHVSSSYNAMTMDTETYVKCVENASLVTDGSDYLTEQVRVYTVTADPECLEKYFTEANVTRRREMALEQFKERQVSEEAMEHLENAVLRSNELMRQELYAMKLVSVAYGYDAAGYPEVAQTALTAEDQALTEEEMVRKAQGMVFDNTYQEAKKAIADDTSCFLDNILDRTRASQQSSIAGLKKDIRFQNVLISILFLETIMTFVIILLLIVRPLHIYVDNIKDEKMLEIMGAYEFRYLALTYNDIYEINAANKSMLRHQAEHDQLTGIINRRGFDQLKGVLKGKPNPMALLIIDVDKFKLINDGYGHETGDQVLKKVADLLVKNFRVTDYPARIGGDEFAVIAVNILQEQKELLSEKINAMNDILMNPTDGLPKVSLSVGIAFSRSGYTDDLYKKADTALYHVKENGRCGYDFYKE